LSEALLPDVSGDWFAAMRRGDWEAAWRATDRLELPRRAAQHAPDFKRHPAHLRWDGTPPQGRAVLVRCEHGLGDTLQFMRFLPLLRARALHFLVQPPLVELLRGAPGLGEVRNYWTDDAPPPHEVDMEVMELAYALRLTLASSPPPYPFLRDQLPSFGLAEDDRLRVGIIWSCSHWEHSRSAPLAELAPLFSVEGVEFYSLQQGEEAADPLLKPFAIEALTPRTADLRMAGAAMCALDLVISIDSMPVHLAATLGRPTWVLLKHEADWRWMDARSDSPWYPSVRLFRQPRPGDWQALAQEVAEALRVQVQAHSGQALSPADPVR
jgi:hypothetical protein